MLLFAKTAIIEYQKPSDLNHRNNSGSSKSEIRYQQGWFLVRTMRKGPIPGLSPRLVDGSLLNASTCKCLYAHLSPNFFFL